MKDIVFLSTQLQLLFFYLHLKYICDTPAQYGEAVSGMSVPFLSIVLLILSAGLAVFALCLQKDARDAARRAQLLHYE